MRLSSPSPLLATTAMVRWTPLSGPEAQPPQVSTLRMIRHFALAVQSDGKIVAAGVACVFSSSCGFALARYNSISGLGNVQVTVQTDPAGLQITVDGTMLTAPQNFSWSRGTNHTIATT